jgi:hypothetical protein
MSRIDYLRLRQVEAKRKAKRAARLHRGQRAAGKALRDATHAVLFAEIAAKRRLEKSAASARQTPADLFTLQGANP